VLAILAARCLLIPLERLVLLRVLHVRRLRRHRRHLPVGLPAGTCIPGAAATKPTRCPPWFGGRRRMVVPPSEREEAAMGSDRIREPWGPRTPFGPGAAWSVRVDGLLADDAAPEQVERWCRRRACCAPTAAGWTSPWRAAASSGCGAAPATGSTTAGWAPRACSAGSQQRGRPADPAAGPRGRRAGGERLGHGHGPRGRAEPAAARHPRPRLDRLLHLRAALLRGVLHPRGDREGGAGHAAHGRQHPAVHGHRGAGAEGDLRQRRAAGQLHRRRPRRHDLPLRPQRRRGADGAVDADPGPAAGAGPAAAGGGRPPPHPDRARPTCPWRPARAPTWRC
jgi:hypothetical protein